jgi:hypothetical protein
LTAEQPVKSFTPVSRNLNSGDAIWIVMAAAANAAAHNIVILSRVNYNIAL